MDLSDNEQDASSLPHRRRMDISEPAQGSGDTAEIPLSDDDIAFVLGKRGATKNKIARVSRTGLRLDEERKVLQIRASTAAARRRGKRYAKLVLQQRTCRPEVDRSDEALKEMVLISVPDDCVARLTGNKGAALRELEDRWDVLVLWVTVADMDTSSKRSGSGSGSGSKGGGNTLAVLGRLQPRTAAELHFVARLAKMDERYLSGKGELDKLLNEIHEREAEAEERPSRDSGPWGVDTSIFDSSEDMRYASGAQGRTKDKIALAAGCEIEFIREVVVFAGYASDRARGQEYMRWLVEQRVGDSVVENEEKRKDCSIIDVDAKNVGFLTGARGAALQRVETATKTFIFTRGKRESGKIARFLVFSFNEGRRTKAIEILKQRVNEKAELDEAKTNYYYSADNNKQRERRSSQRSNRERDNQRSSRRGRNGRGRSDSPVRSSSWSKGRRDGRRQHSRNNGYDVRGSRRARSRSPRYSRR